MSKSLGFVEQSLNGWLKPKVFAESWDNVGLLIGSGRSSKLDKNVNSILCCNDLTTRVITEAISLKVDMVIAYHPPIFSPLKAVAYGSWKEEIVARCLGHDICLYSPHTMLDAIMGGINDRIMDMLRTVLPSNDDSTLEAITPSNFLAKSCRGISFKSTSENITKLYAAIPLNDVTVSFDVQDLVNGNGDIASLSVYPSLAAEDCLLDEIKNIAENLNIPDFKNVLGASPAVLGSGRILRFKKPVNIMNIVESLRKCTNVPTIKLAEGSKKEVNSVALCVGSGASILKGLDVDVLITGEMTHHDVLDCLEQGQSIILCGHAASERHYLPTLAAIVKIVTQCPNVMVSKEEQSIFRFV